MDMFFQDDDMSVNMEEELPYARRSSLTYEEIAKDLVFEEGQYMRELNMIIKVFRADFVRLFRGSKVSLVVISVLKINLSHVGKASALGNSRIISLSLFMPSLFINFTQLYHTILSKR